MRSSSNVMLVFNFSLMRYFFSFRVKSKLKCRYNFGFHSYLTFMPYKEEIMSLKPKVSVFLEVLSDREIASIKELAFPRVRILCKDLYFVGCKDCYLLVAGKRFSFFKLWGIGTISSENLTHSLVEKGRT